MATLEYLVRAVDQASGTFSKVGLSADRLDRQLADLSKRIASPTVDLKDKEFATKMADAAVRLDRLAKKVANPKIQPEGLRRAELDILKLDAMLDELDGKTATVTVDVDRRRGIFSRLGGLFGGGGGGLLSGGPSGLGTGVLGLGQAGPIAGGGLAALAAALGPALIPAGLGLGVGGAATIGAFDIGKKANEQLQKLNRQLASAQGAQRKAIQQQIKALEKTSGPELGIFSALQDVGIGARGAFAGALKAGGPGGAPSFLTGLTGILKQLGGFVDKLGPQLGQVFRASLPFLQMFVKVLEQAAKVLLPAFTQSLKSITPFIPQLTQGFTILVQGLADFIKDLGPGMKDSTTVFLGLMTAVKGILIGLAYTLNYTAKVFANLGHVVTDIARTVGKWWDWLQHHTAAVFDGMRHDIAAAWNAIFNNTIGRVAAGLTAVVGDFKALPGRVLGALRGLGHSLYAFGHAALNDLWSGFKSVAGSILGWVKDFVLSIPRKILGFLHMSPPHPGSVFFDLGASFMHHLEAGMKSRAGSVAGSVTGAFMGTSGALGGDSAANRALARRLFPWPASMWPAFDALEMREAGYNRFARNPSSGAYGIPQALPESKLPFAGQAAGGSHAGAQLAWMFSYIAGRYRNPINAWAHEQAFNWYGRGFHGLVDRPTIFGAGEAGRERVDITPVGQGRGHRDGPLVNIENYYAQSPTDATMLAQQFSWRIVSAGLGS